MSEQTTSLHIKILSDEVDVAKRRLDQLEASGRGAEKTTKSLTSNVQKQVLAFVASAVSITAVSAAVGVATRNWLAYDKNMKEVSSIMSTSRQEFRGLRDDVLDLSITLGVDAATAAKALYEAISAGIPKENAIAFLAVASKTAIAGVTDVATAVDVLTNVINSYKIPVEDAEIISDKLFATVKIGKTTMEELSQSMSKGTVSAAALGVDLDELLASVAGITLQGTPTAEAFTQINATITALLNPSDELTVVLKRMGFESARVAVETLGFGETLNRIRSTIGENDAMLVKATRSIEGFKGVLSLTGDNAKSFGTSLDGISKSSGETATAYKTNAETMATAQVQLKNSFTQLVENFEAHFGTIATTGKLLKMVALEIAGINNKSLDEASSTGGIQGATVLQKRLEQLRSEKAQLEYDIKNGGVSRAVFQASPVGRITGGRTDLEELERNRKEIEGITEALAKQEEGVLKVAAAMRAVDEANKTGNAGLIESKKAELAAIVEASEKEKALTQERKEIMLEAENLQKLIDDGKEARTQELFKKEEERQKLLEETANRVEAQGADKLAVLEKEVALTNELIATSKDPTQIENANRYLELLKSQKQELESQNDYSVLPPLLTSAEEIAQQRALSEEIKKTATSEREALEIKKESYSLFAKTHPQESQAAQEAIAAIDLKIAKLSEEESLKAENAGKEVQREAARKATALDQLTQAFLPNVDESNRFALEEAEVVRSYNQRMADIIEITDLTQQERSSLITESEKKLADDLDRINADKNESTRNAIQTGLSDVASIQGQFGEKAFRLAQGAAIAEATMSMHTAAVNAYKSGANIPGLGPVLAGAALIAGAANIASIASQKYSGAYAMGGMIPAGSFGLVGEAGPEFVQGPAIVTSARETAKQRSGGSESNAVSVTINNVPGHEVETRQSEDGKNLEFTIKAVVDRLTSEAQNGGGRFVPALARAHGLTRKA